MLKKEKGLFIIFGIVLVLLYLLSSTNLIIKEKKTEIYPISVIIKDSKDEYYQNFKKGMDQAARTYHVDTNFITLYEKNDHEQQMELMEREINDGAKAIILAPADVEKTLRELEERKLVIPVILLETRETNDWVSGNVTMDYYEAGALLGKEVLADVKAETTVHFFTEGLGVQSHQEFYDGCLSVLEPAGVSVRLYAEEGGSGFQNSVGQMMQQKGKKAAIALDSGSLTALTDILEKAGEDAKEISLYGIGVNVGILNDLDSGLIRGLVVNNQFHAGYLSIEKAVREISMGIQKEEILLEPFYIRQENLRQPEYEKMLYPME